MVLLKWVKMKIFVGDFEQIVDRGKLLYEYDGVGNSKYYNRL